jgi:hypothetical protein
LRRHREHDDDARPVVRRPGRLRDRLLAARRRHDSLCASAAVSSAEARDTPLPLGVAIARADADASTPACFSEARKSVRYVAGGSLHLDAVALDTSPATLGLAAWDDRGDRFVAWHCVVAPRADGHWSGRVSLAGVGWTIGTGSGERRVCRFVHAPGAAPIGATIAHSSDLTDIDRALVAENFLVVPGGDPCPRDPVTEPHQP